MGMGMMGLLLFSSFVPNSSLLPPLLVPPFFSAAFPILSRWRRWLVIILLTLYANPSACHFLAAAAVWMAQLRLRTVLLESHCRRHRHTVFGVLIVGTACANY